VDESPIREGEEGLLLLMAGLTPTNALKCVSETRMTRTQGDDNNNNKDQVPADFANKKGTKKIF
jgi:hypothetical protein